MDIIWRETHVLNFSRAVKGYSIFLSVYPSDDVAGMWEWSGSISFENGTRSWAEDYAPTLDDAKAAVAAWFAARVRFVSDADTRAEIAGSGA